MNKIKTSTLYFDLLERLDTALNKGQVSSDLERKVKSRARIFYAINEAVKFFVTKAPVPLNALSGYIPSKLYHLQESDVTDYDGLAVYKWPEVANKSRADAGLLRLNLDGKVFEPVLLSDPEILNVRITSLQNQASNTLMYGPSHQNAVVDLNGTQIFVPSDVVPKAQVVINPDLVSTIAMARGKHVLTVTGPATANGDITITNVTEGEDITVAVEDGDTEEEVAALIVEAVNDASDLKLQTVLFADEGWFYTKESGESAFTNVTVDVGDTGVTLATGDDDFDLEPAETEEIPIDETHQEILAIAAFNHLVNNVAFLGQGTEDGGQAAE